MIQQPKNILIIKPSARGDIVLALPALSALKKSFPQAKVSWLVRPEYADLLRGHPDLDEIILFDRKRLSKWWCSRDSFNSLRLLVKQLRAGQFDLVFDFQGLFRTGFLGWMTGSKRRFGTAGAREFAHLFYTHKVAQDSSCVHLVDYYLRMVSEAGAPQAKPEFKLPEDTASTETVDKLLKSQNVNSGYVVLVPGAARKEKCWGIWHFSDIADEIAEKFGLSIVATGSQGERVAIEALQELTTTRIANLAGKTSISELIALLKKASLVISNDTGPGHIAAALGAPIVMIFGPTNPARVCPYGRPECVVAVEPTTRGMKADSYDPKHDIGHITIEQVFEKACKQIGKKGV